MHAWYVAIVHIAAVARAFLGSCAPAGSAPPSWKCMMVFGTCGFRLYRSHIVFGRWFSAFCMNACAHVADNPIGLFLLRFRCSMNNHTNSEYLSNMRGHVEIIQIHNIMAVESEAGTRRTAHCSTALRL